MSLSFSLLARLPLRSFRSMQEARSCMLRFELDGMEKVENRDTYKLPPTMRDAATPGPKLVQAYVPRSD